MALTEAQVLVDLSNATLMYDLSQRQFNEMLDFAGDLGENSEDDEFQMAATGQVVVAQQATVAAQYDPILTDLIREFQPVVGTSVVSIDTGLRRLKKYMELTTKNVKSRGVVYTTSQPVSFTGIGDQQLYVCSLESGNYVNEAVTIETIRFEAIRQAESLKTRGAEQYRVRGTGGRGQKSELDGRGRGVIDTTIFAFESGSKSNLVKNASFDLPVNGTSVNKIQFWEILSPGDTGNFTISNAQIAKDRGGSHRALAITGTGTIRFLFRRNDKALSRLLPYIAGFRAFDDASAGEVVCRVGSAGGSSYTLTYTATGANVYTQETLDPDTQFAWADNFDTNGDPYIEFECTIAPTGGNATIFIDDVLFREMTRIGGRYVALVSGLVDAVTDDFAEHAVDLDYGTGSVELTGGAGGSIDSITADGVELLRNPIPFDTSLAITADAAVLEINENRTFPNYFANRTGDFINLEQEVPAEGTVVVVSAATTITTADTNITGASLGRTQDFITRRRGVTLKHAGSATAGWGS